MLHLFNQKPKTGSFNRASAEELRWESMTIFTGGVGRYGHEI
jgi:hypothetical protein